jgi:hypothetical protein
MALREAEPEHAGVGRGALRSAMRANTRAKELSRDALTVRSMGMAQATHIYGEVKNKTDLKKIFTGMRRDVGEARSRPDLTELYKRAGYLITLTHAPSWEEKFGKEAVQLRKVATEEFGTTARKINSRAKQIGTEADYDET